MTAFYHDTDCCGSNRRAFLRDFACGFGGLALNCLLAEEARAAAPASSSILAPRPPHFPARAKRVIFLFMEGGPSQVDTFDPKPVLSKFHGKKLDDGPAKGVAFGSPFKFTKHGQSGVEVSDVFPHVGRCVDDIAVIRSMYCDRNDHGSAISQLFTGEPVAPRPSMGSWVTYGLGSENQSLPGLVVLSTSNRGSDAGNKYGTAGFLPAAHQGTMVTSMDRPIAHLAKPSVEQERQLETLRQLNALHQAGREEDTRLSARIGSFELAARMQLAAPEAFDLTQETETTRELYGIDKPTTAIYGRELLLARRLIERGVRFVVAKTPHIPGINDGDPPRWDHHSDLAEVLPMIAERTDQPIAGLLKDLKQRGLLKDTLVVWGGEFGRTVTYQASTKGGRDHHRHGFSMWLAGGGVKGGLAYGATDELGHSSVEHKVHMHDLHATILHLLGLDHEKLTYRYGGRDYRLTDVYGRVVKDIVA